MGPVQPNVRTGGHLFQTAGPIGGGQPLPDVLFLQHRCVKLTQQIQGHQGDSGVFYLMLAHEGQLQIGEGPIYVAKLETLVFRPRFERLHLKIAMEEI